MNNLLSYPSIDPTPSPMVDFRMANNKPILFDLIHKWNLSSTQIELLTYYKLKHVDAIRLCHDLNDCKGRLKLFIPVIGTTLTFIPIYQNCTRQDINHYRAGDSYYLSFRATKCGQNFVLIQPVE